MTQIEICWQLFADTYSFAPDYSWKCPNFVQKSKQFMIYDARFQISLKKYQKKRIDLDSKSREFDSLKISTPTESRSSTPQKFRLLRSRRVRLPKIYDSSGVEEFDSFQISTLFGLTTPNSWSSTPNSESGVVSLLSMLTSLLIES